MREILLFFFVFFFTIECLYSQDSLINKPINTKKFDITAEYTDSIKNKTGNYIKYKRIGEYEDCFEVLPLSDTNFRFSHNIGKNNLLYKDVQEISFRGKSFKGEGIFLGAVGGFFVALLSYSAFNGAIFKHSEMPSPLFSFIILPVICIGGGTAIGWTIGANLHSWESYDLSNYAPDKRKEQSIKIFFEHRLNF